MKTYLLLALLTILAPNSVKSNTPVPIPTLMSICIPVHSNIIKTDYSENTNKAFHYSLDYHTSLLTYNDVLNTPDTDWIDVHYRTNLRYMAEMHLHKHICTKFLSIEQIEKMLNSWR